MLRKTKMLFSLLVVLLLLLVLIVAVMFRSPLSTLNSLVPTSTFEMTAGVPYGPLTRQKLDIYRPAQGPPAAGYPVVVFFYGGAWNRGEKADYKFVGEALASRGVVTLVADYRLYPEVRYPDFLSDSASAMVYGLKQVVSLQGNPKRIFVMGHSAGAYNAAMLALDARWLKVHGHSPSELAGFIGLAGPYDFLPMTNTDTQPVFFHPNYPENSQPIRFVTSIAPAGFLGAARTDSLVNPDRNTVQLSALYEAAGAKVTLKLYERVNHMTLAASLAKPLRWLAPVFDDVMGFIETH
jgi:acetyl esterase/lipase